MLQRANKMSINPKNGIFPLHDSELGFVAGGKPEAKPEAGDSCYKHCDFSWASAPSNVSYGWMDAGAGMAGGGGRIPSSGRTPPKSGGGKGGKK